MKRHKSPRVASSHPSLSLERYALRGAGAPVAVEAVERIDVLSVQVTSRWGDNVLGVTDLVPPRDFTIGEMSESRPVDGIVPAALLGLSQTKLLVATETGAAVVILPTMRGSFDVPGHARQDLRSLAASGVLRQSLSVDEAYELDLPPGCSVHAQFGNGIEFEIRAGNAGRQLPVSLIEWPAALVAACGISLALVGGTMAAAYFGPLGMSADDNAEMDRDQMLSMRKLLTAAAERELTRDTTQSDSAGNPGGAAGAKAAGAEGQMGKRDSAVTHHRYAVQGPKDNPDPHIARMQAIKDAQSFGTIGLLSSSLLGDLNAPVAVWGRDTSLGRDERSAMGAMFGEAIGDNNGFGGMGMRGTDDGGGGDKAAIGMMDVGSIGNLGHDEPGPGGMGHHASGTRPTYHPHAPRLTPDGNTTVNGRLPAEIIQRVVHQNYGRFRLCYDSGLRTNPSLAGRVAVKFIIDRTGAVSMSADSGSDLPDRAVVSCVVRAFGNLSFPAPEGGIVTIAYPFRFTPG